MLTTNAEINRALAKAGWAKSQGHHHTRWKCPCGEHSVITSRSSKEIMPRNARNCRAACRQCKHCPPELI